MTATRETGHCPICGHRRSARYVNAAAGEACVHQCHWPYLSPEEVARASMVRDRIVRDANANIAKLGKVRDYR